MTGIFTESAIHQKSPQEITALLYEACLNNLEESIQDIQSKDYVIANKKLQRANDILYRLGAGLNYDAGIISDQLDMLYNYMADKLVEANLTKDVEIIQNVIQTLEEISSAWSKAMKNKTLDSKTAIRQKTLAYEKSVLMEDN
ncbi:flagellar export chaperone FliS [Bacillus sp. S/N-304-OC-R1]|uniref:flagellar export chaperone FliS n=1 Tax=Bacillus sp. S/N-304-OC-R1 TaxID=2758034 RepID=UPI001C8D829E|nr:flagellar export chaperone FliS [Bacillus sp. S/N-304-OC-R1]MBY0123474.1 flagellar export chaperone FliS [Bacillus sp. S/N-304-OC-R1]